MFCWLHRIVVTTDKLVQIVHPWSVQFQDFWWSCKALGVRIGHLLGLRCVCTPETTILDPLLNYLCCIFLVTY